MSWDEDFLYHLSRGSDLLVENRVVEAKEELERALAYRPEDAKSQDLLAGVYFRLGVYPRAIELWARLVRSYPDDPTLRVNLGLALIKTGQPEQAAEHLMRAIAIEPDHPRAWGYLGLVRWRAGKLDEARDCFLKGGQASMARRMEELSGTGPGKHAAAELDRREEEVKITAADAIEKLDEDETVLELATPRAPRPRRSSSEWRVIEAGLDGVPRSPQAQRLPSADAPMALSSLLEWWTPSLTGEETLAVTLAGLLVMSNHAAVYGREVGLRALRGEARSFPVMRRFTMRARNGRSLVPPKGHEETLGENEPILRWEGAIVAVLAPRAGERFQALRLAEEPITVVESYVQAFEDGIEIESSRLPAHAGSLPLLSLRGRGTVVLRIPRPPTAVPLRGNEMARVEPEAVLGWINRLAVQQAPVGGGLASLGVEGEGTLLLV